MTSLTMVTTRTSKTAGEVGPDASLLSLTNIDTLPLYGHNRESVTTQMNMFSVRDQLNATSVFKVPDYGTSVVDAGLLILTFTYIVSDMSTVPGLTTDNAYDLCVSTKLTEATALNIGEYQDWKTKYFAEHFTVSNVVTTSEPA